MSEEFDFRRLRRRGRGRAVHAWRRCRWCTRSRPTACGSAAAGAIVAYTGDTGPCEALDGSPPVPTCCSPRRRSATATTTRPASTSPAPTAAARRPRRRRAAGDHPHPAVVRQGGRCSPRPERSGTARPSWPPGATSTSSDGLRPDPASWTQIAICTRLVTCSLSKSRDTCAFTVGTDRCSARGDLGVGQAAADSEGDLVLALGEHAEPQPRDLAPVVARVVADPLDQGPGHRGGQHRVAVRDRPDRLEDLRRGSVLEQEAVAPPRPAPRPRARRRRTWSAR